MADSPNLQSLIDACRPDGDDLQQPEFAPLAAALKGPGGQETADRLAAAQAFDRAVQAELESASLPPGLAERLLEKLAAQEASVAPATPAALPFRRRRWLVAALASTAALVLLAAGLYLASGPRGPVTKRELAEQAQHWFEEVQAEGPWRADWSAAAADFPVDSRLRVRPLRWRALASAEGVAYELSPPGQPKAWLLVIRAARPHEVDSLPFTALNATGRFAVGAWQQGSWLYVLGVDSRAGRLQDFVRPTPLG